MSFFERAKSELLARNQEEIDKIDIKLHQLYEEIYHKKEKVESLIQEKNNAHYDKSQYEKKVLNSKERENLEKLYNFIANFKRIELIIEELKKMKPVYNPDEIIVDYSDESLSTGTLYYDIARKKEFSEKLKILNDTILQICDLEVDELELKIDEISKEKSERKGFLSKIFNKFSKKAPNIEQEQDLLSLYREKIEDFNEYYNKFMILFANDNNIVIKKDCLTVISNIKYIYSLQKNNIELTKEQEEYLSLVEPIELWNEALRYYNNMEIIKSIVIGFDNNFKFFEKLYKTNPELFDIEYLKNLLIENDLTFIDLKTKRKEVKVINDELIQSKGDTKEIKTQIAELEKRKKELLEKRKKIEKSKKLNELGYKDKDDASKKLNISLQEYIVIEVPSDINNFQELFNDEKKLKIEADGKTFNSSYSNDVAYGKINSVKNDKNINLVILIPIKNLKREDIDSIREGKIGLYSSILKTPQILVIKNGKRQFDFGDKKFEIINESKSNLYGTVKKFLGEDFTDDYIEEVENYEIFKGIPTVSQKEKKLKRDAIKTSLFENLSRDFTSEENILVNEKPYFLNMSDIVDMNIMKSDEPINEDYLKTIIDKIEDYLIEGSHSSIRIDNFYKSLLTEYLRICKKTKAEYIEEEYTTISINQKKYSIKPVLPAKNENISRKYTRKNENIAYKMIKLAALVNRFAHMTENPELQYELFQIKNDLIEEVIDLAKKNPNIKIRQNFDENKRVNSVIIEIPGYNMIALHLMNRSSSLMKKSNSLEINNSSIVHTSTILYPGVNRELLLAMKKLDINSRKKLLLNLDNNTFYKLMIRMGYNSDMINSQSDKKEFIEKVISDEAIDKLIKDSNEIELE